MSRLPYRPRRPRASQSGREKRRGESFQAQAEKPLGTDSHRTISKRSNECWLLIGHKKRFIWLFLIAMSISTVLLVSTRLLSRHTSPVCLPRLCVQRKISFCTFLTRNEGTTDESEKRFRCKFRFWPITVVNNTDFKMPRRWRQRERQKSNSLTMQNNNFARASRFFVHFFTVTVSTTTTWKYLISRFEVDVNKQWQNFLFLSEGVIDASLNTCCQLKLVFLEKRL